tara:strand:- start:252 stop:986 length:735 start_codon:yes stop_codon:yes gene_type:complete
MINKKLVLYTFIVLNLFLSCDNEPYEGEFIVEDNSCALAIQATESALENYNLATDDNRVSLCHAYVEALENQIVICGDDGVLLNLINELGDCEPELFDITGGWKLISIFSLVARDLDNDDELTNDYFEDLNCYTNETLVFNPDGTGTFFYKSYAELQMSSVNGSVDDIDFTVNCIEENLDTEFTWEETDFNLTEVTLNIDNSVLTFFRNEENIFLTKIDGFVVTSLSDNLDSITEDVVCEYVKL